MPQTIQRSFTSGEISPSLRARADMVKYATGLALCENMIIRAQGGCYSRPGMRYIGEQDSSTTKGRLIEFIFNTDQTYILVFEQFKMRVIKDGAFVLAGGGPAIYELVTPYGHTQLPDIKFAQNADVITLTHPAHSDSDLSRTADDNWSLDINDYSPTVDAPVWSTTTTISVTNVSQSSEAVVTTSAAHGLSTNDSVRIESIVGMTDLNGRYFEAEYVDATNFRLRDENSSGYSAYVSGGTVNTNDPLTPFGKGAGDYEKTYNYVVTAVDEDGVESLASSSEEVTTKSLSVTAGVRLQWAAVTDAEYYRIYKDPSSNTDVYGWIGDSNTTVFEDYNLAPITSDAPPEDRQPFTGVGNKPSCVNYYQQRRVFANTNNEPQAVYTTQTGNFKSLRTSRPTRDDDAITFAIAANQVNEIRHLVSLDSLIILTSGGEWKTTEGQDQVLTPSSIGTRIQSYNGASDVAPVIINSTALYVQEKGTKIRDLGYDFSSDKYTGNDLSLMAEHLFDGYTITDMSYADEPYGIVWCVRDDGVLLGLTYQREHQVWAWHKHVTDGEFESVATVPEGGRDATYVIVKRSIDGSTVRYIERMEPRELVSAADAFCVDSGLSYSGSPETVFSGLNHLEGEPVAVLADGNVLEGLVVSSGSITLPFAASTVHVGLPYTPAMELLDIDAASAAQTIKGRVKSISKVIMELQSSRGGWVGPKLDDGSTGEMEEIKPRNESDGYGAIELKDYKADVIIDSSWVRGGGIRIEQRSPLPLAVLSVIPQLDIGGS